MPSTPKTFLQPLPWGTSDLSAEETFEDYTQRPGYSRAASRAKTSVTPDTAKDSKESVQGCGTKCSASSPSYGPNSSLSKTSPHSLAGDSSKFSKDLMKRGTMRNGRLYPHKTSGHYTAANGSGSSPTLGTPTVIGSEQLCNNLRAHETWETAQNLPAQLMRYSLCLSGRQPKPKGHFLPNPWLLERLMGYEAGYTETAHSETPSSRSAPQKS